MFTQVDGTAVAGDLRRTTVAVITGAGRIRTGLPNR